MRDELIRSQCVYFDALELINLFFVQTVANQKLFATFFTGGYVPDSVHDRIRRFSRRSVLGYMQMESIARVFLATGHLDGDVAECGCAAGGLSFLLAAMMKDEPSERKLHMFDSFEGLPKPDRDYDRFYTASSFKADRRQIERAVAQADLRDIVEIHPGWFEDTLPRFAERAQLSFVHLDGDLYHSTQTALRHLYPQVVENGCVVFDDFFDGSRGVLRAATEHLTRTQEVVFVGPFSQAHIRKGCTVSNYPGMTTRYRVGGSVIEISFDELRKQTGYLEFLKTYLAAMEARVLAGSELVSSIESGEVSIEHLDEPAFPIIEVPCES